MTRLLKVSVAAMVTALLAYGMVAHFSSIRANIALRDSIAYWAAGRQLDQRQNPYDHAAVLEIERQQGYRDQRPLVLRTPPWSLFMVAPLGVMSPLLAWVSWIAFSLACLLIGMRLCSRLYLDGTPPNFFTVVGYTFAPVPACLVSGQMGLVLMLGIVLFFWWEQERPILAGAFLTIPFAKPHLLALFWIVFAFWIITRKQFKIALGFGITLILATGLALVLDPAVFRHYREMLHVASIGNEFIPAFSGVIRLIFFRRFFWVQFIPLAIGLVWALRFFFRNSSIWNWRQHGPALLVVSVLTTPYEWLSDETVLLPAILQAVAFAYAARESLKWTSKAAIVMFGSLNILLLLILKSKVPFSTGIYFWSTLVWFFWYFCARKWFLRSQEQSPG